MYIRKSLFVVSVIVPLIIGMVIGTYALGRYIYVTAPQKAQQAAAKKHEEEMNKLVRRGTIISVAPEKLSMKVEKGGGDIGKTMTYRTTEYTSIQVAMKFVNNPGQKADLTKWFKVSDNVDVLVKDDRILALHRELRSGEKEIQSPVKPERPKGS